jgi:hypothetical protein
MGEKQVSEKEKLCSEKGISSLCWLHAAESSARDEHLGLTAFYLSKAIPDLEDLSKCGIETKRPKEVLSSLLDEVAKPEKGKERIVALKAQDTIRLARNLLCAEARIIRKPE